MSASLHNKQVVLISLLAIPPSVREDEPGLQTRIGKKLFRALADYHANVVDDATWDCLYFRAEQGVPEETERTSGNRRFIACRPQSRDK